MCVHPSLSIHTCYLTHIPPQDFLKKDKTDTLAKKVAGAVLANEEWSIDHVLRI
jgi:hypothetical protein